MSSADLPMSFLKSKNVIFLQNLKENRKPDNAKLDIFNRSRDIQSLILSLVIKT